MSVFTAQRLKVRIFQIPETNCSMYKDQYCLDWLTELVNEPSDRRSIRYRPVRSMIPLLSPLSERFLSQRVRIPLRCCADEPLLGISCNVRGIFIRVVEDSIKKIHVPCFPVLQLHTEQPGSFQASRCTPFLAGRHGLRTSSDFSIEVS